MKKYIIILSVILIFLVAVVFAGPPVAPISTSTDPTAVHLDGTNDTAGLTPTTAPESAWTIMIDTGAGWVSIAWSSLKTALGLPDGVDGDWGLVSKANTGARTVPLVSGEWGLRKLNTELMYQAYGLDEQRVPLDVQITADVNPNTVYDRSTVHELVLCNKTKGAMTVTNLTIFLRDGTNADPTTEMTGTVYFKTTPGIDRTSPTTLTTFTTVAGAFSDAPNGTSLVPDGAMIWMVLGADPDATTYGMDTSLTGVPK